MAVRVFILLTLACWQGAPVTAQLPPDPNYVRQPIFDSYSDFRTELFRVATIEDDAVREVSVNKFWQQLRDAGQVPYAQGDRVAFLYRGSGAVAWPGDANRWNPNAAGWQGSPVGQSDIQILERQLPADARVDYKIVTHGVWRLDPANPLQMWSGFGPNNELRMPQYEYPQETVVGPDVPRGAWMPNQTIASTQLGYDVRYRVYVPAGYDASEENLPSVYFTDGHEYSATHMGSATEVIDNLIAERRMRPALAVFIDPRSPATGQNQREDQYISNPDFARFVADELVPTIDGNYRTIQDASERTIVGTSLGGLNSAYFGAVEHDTFRNLGIQSPAFWADEEIYTMYKGGALKDEVRIFMTTGTINDEGGATPFSAILKDGMYDFTFTTANEGHSWGNWRAQLDDILIGLVGPSVPEPSGVSLLFCGLVFWGIARPMHRREPWITEPAGNSRCLGLTTAEAPRTKSRTLAAGRRNHCGSHKKQSSI